MPFTITDTTRITQLQSFLQTQQKHAPVVLAYDDDADGLCAGISMYETLQKLGFETIITKPKTKDTPVFKKEQQEDFLSQGVQTIICVDFEPISWRFLEEEQLSTFPFNLIIIDHHFNATQQYDVHDGQKKRLFIHPTNSAQCDNPSQYCCAKFVYDVCSHMVDITHVEWKIAAGMIGDMNIIEWSDYVKALLEKQHVLVGENRDSFFYTPNGRFANIVGFAASASGAQVQAVFDAYLQATSIEQMLGFEDQYKEQLQLFESVLKSAFDKSKEYKGVRMYQIFGKYKLSSICSSIVSYLHPQYIWFFYQDAGDGFYHISLRSNARTHHLGELAQFVAKDFDQSNGGGHIPAAGAICKVEDFEDFKNRILDSLELFVLSE
ncbi:MAG: DHHA1 domain-containing protein [Candidatus Woesearchaeota archaeon]